MTTRYFVVKLACLVILCGALQAAEPKQPMNLIPAQTFIMGNLSGSSRNDALPAHPVTLDAFYMSPHLVSVQQYCDFLNESGWVEVKGSCVVYKESKDALFELWLGPIIQEGERYVPRSGLANRPMYYVFWKGAALYCNYLSVKEGLEPCYQLANMADMLKGDILAKPEWPCDLTASGYHLPTEAQWECAARGGLQGKRYPWGDQEINSKLANYDNQVGHFSDVGSYPANAYGLYDMVGNIMQWCNDWYDYGYYTACATGIRNPIGPIKLQDSKFHAIRGGSYYQPAEYQTCHNRYGPSDGRAGYNFNGFRIVREALVDTRVAATETRTANEWIEKSFNSTAAEHFPVSFTLGGKHSAELLKHWLVVPGKERSENGKRIRTIVLRDPKTLLEIECEVTTFAGFPAVDWLLHVTNRGTEKSPIIQDLQVLDYAFAKPVTEKREYILRHSRGSRMSALDFAPTDDVLLPGSQRVLAGHNGRSSDYDLPFMNLSWGRGGVVLGVGWTGQWQSQFMRDDKNHVRIISGMQHTHLSLHPGESIRTPRQLLIFWDGTDMLDGHNLFRRLILAHYNPRIDGKLITPPISRGVADLNGYTEQNQLEAIPKLKETGIEVLWIDAGWFVGGWPHGMGNWIPRPECFPSGLGPIGEAAHKAGLKFLVWFEPERVSRGSMIDKGYPQWVIGPVTEWGGLFNWGIPEARQWLTDLLSKQISDGKIDIFRSDFNMEPLAYLQRSDSTHRQGMAEIRFFEGMYQMWDDLRQRHPGLWIDNCASGGRMIDLETTLRSIPLWQSDSQVDGGAGVTAQLQNAGLNLYIPMHCGGNVGNEPSYIFRSALMSGNPLGDVPANEQGRATVATFHQVRPYFEGDYFPLFEHSINENIWWGYQLDLPQEGRGMVLAFRREQSPYAKNALLLHNIDKKAEYEVFDKDGGTTTRMSGLRLKSIIVEIPAAPGSRMLFYKRL
jgi:alpha-galactosidase